MDDAALDTPTEMPAQTRAETPSQAPAHEHHHGYMTQKDKYLSRLRRIEGQARGIHRMVDEDTYCIDILTQISATTAALENVAMALLEDHLRHCVADAVAAGGDEGEAKLQEATAAIRRLVKS